MIELLMKKYLSQFRAEKVLEIGPGYGRFGLIAARLTGAEEITFLDYNEEVLEYQVNQAKDASLSSNKVHMLLSEHALKALDTKYDLILCQEVLEHLTNAEEILTALTGCLKEHGLIVITVPTKISEQLIKLINPTYMEGEAHGHVRQFNNRDLNTLLSQAGLRPVVFRPTQPHYFISHLWLFGTRMKIDGATGQVVTGGLRAFIWKWLNIISKRVFLATGSKFWGYLLPRNYFVIGTRSKL